MAHSSILLFSINLLHVAFYCKCHSLIGYAIHYLFSDKLLSNVDWAMFLILLSVSFLHVYSKLFLIIIFSLIHY